VALESGRNANPARQAIMTAPAVTPQELAEVRRRMQAALLDTSRPLSARMEEFRRLLRESRLCAASVETSWTSLQDSF
jgi:hypothetical protein